MLPITPNSKRKCALQSVTAPASTISVLSGFGRKDRRDGRAAHPPNSSQQQGRCRSYCTGIPRADECVDLLFLVKHHTDNQRRIGFLLQRQASHAYQSHRLPEQWKGKARPRLFRELGSGSLPLFRQRQLQICCRSGATLQPRLPLHCEVQIPSHRIDSNPQFFLCAVQSISRQALMAEMFRQ